jgi:VanZ family protein
MAHGRWGRTTVDRALFALTLAISVFLLLWPSVPSDPPFRFADKLLHVAIFVAIAWTGSRVGLPLWALGVGLVAYAIGTELVQQFLLPHRSGDWTDVAADVVGAIIGLTLARSHPRFPRAREWADG